MLFPNRNQYFFYTEINITCVFSFIKNIKTSVRNHTFCTFWWELIHLNLGQEMNSRYNCLLYRDGMSNCSNMKFCDNTLLLWFGFTKQFFKVESKHVCSVFRYGSQGVHDVWDTWIETEELFPSSIFNWKIPAVLGQANYKYFFTFTWMLHHPSNQ